MKYVALSKWLHCAFSPRGFHRMDFLVFANPPLLFSCAACGFDPILVPPGFDSIRTPTGPVLYLLLLVLFRARVIFQFVPPLEYFFHSLASARLGG